MNLLKKVTAMKRLTTAQKVTVMKRLTLSKNSSDEALNAS
jgi:hypothetical protein